jgi:ABC-type Zn uptake system ZnuABC Zn-binding protein ZnuA
LGGAEQVAAPLRYGRLPMFRRSPFVTGTALVVALMSGLSGCSSTTSGVGVSSDAVAPLATDAADGPAIASNTGDWFTCAPSAPYDGLSPIASGKRLAIATTVAPITSIVSNVVGSLAEVEGIVPEGTNSHTFEPKPSVAKLLADANIVFVNGLKLEEPTKELANANMKSGAALVELGSRTITPDQELYDFSFPKEGGKPNPHLWTDPKLGACYARIAADAMKQADPSNADAYEFNAAAYIDKLRELDVAFRAASDTVPPANRKLLTYHDAYAYFAKDYGWEVIGAIQVNDFEEPTAREVADLIEQVKELGVPAIFGSEVFPSPVLEQIGREARVTYVEELRDDDLPGAPGDAEHSYLGLMRFDLATMVKALGGDPSALLALDVSDLSKDAAVYPQ